MDGNDLSREVKLYLIIAGLVVIIGVGVFLYLKKPADIREHERIIELAKTNQIIVERLVVLSNQGKELAAEDKHEKATIDRLGALTNAPSDDLLKLFYTLQSNQ